MPTCRPLRSPDAAADQGPGGLIGRTAGMELAHRAPRGPTARGHTGLRGRVEVQRIVLLLRDQVRRREPVPTGPNPRATPNRRRVVAYGRRSRHGAATHRSPDRAFLPTPRGSQVCPTGRTASPADPPDECGLRPTGTARRRLARSPPGLSFQPPLFGPAGGRPGATLELVTPVGTLRLFPDLDANRNTPFARYPVRQHLGRLPDIRRGGGIKPLCTPTRRGPRSAGRGRWVG